MKHPKRTCGLVFVFFCVLTGAVFAQNQPQAGTIRVFAINQTDQAVDIEFGKNPTVFSAPNLGAFSAGRMREVAQPGAYQVFFKSNGSKEFLSPRNEGGQPFLYQVEAGKNYAIRIQDKSVADVVELEEASGLQAKICFINASPQLLNQVQVASEFNRNILVYLRSLAPKSISTFANVNWPASYAIYWAKPEAASDPKNFQSILDASGKPLFNLYENTSYWAFLAYQDKVGAVNGRLFKLLP